MIAIFRRELRAYFASPIGFIFMGFFLLVSGILFAVGNILQANPTYSGLLDSLTFVFMMIVPVLTMRLFSEEMRHKTDQLLITSPLPITGIVAGKYLAAVAVFFLTLAVTVIYPVLMSFFAFFGVAGWEIAGGYIGFFLMGSSFIAVGLFFSSVTDNQLVAAVVTLAALLLMWILDWISKYVPTDAVSGLVFLGAAGACLILLVFFSTRSIPATVAFGVVAAAVLTLLFVFSRGSFEGIITKILNWFSLLKRFSNFNAGILSLSSIVYYLSFSGAFVFLTIRLIEKRRWA
jgi:ABC-2 type transport system permease protein